ncbi:MarR family winged helix-turn-helix transcriptional regulator [Achromobacter spanius]|uniref:MarR family winged helix-turn-helix transcriptional regulator n=1 Tax=Achromobacter spanius TaxID=217203 RepID=UPI003A8E6112
MACVSAPSPAGLHVSRSGVGPRGWRILALLGAPPDMSLNAVAREANIDKSQASRTVSDLIERGLIKRSADAQDARGVSLDLTRAGKKLYQEVFPAAIERNEEMLAVLSEDEREVLERALDKMTSHMLDMLNDLKAEVPTRRGRGVQPR